MVDSCTKENGVLYTVAQSWLLFLHDESEWKNFESNIVWGVDELHQTFWFEQFFDGKLCCKIRDFLSVSIIFFWIDLLGAISRWMCGITQHSSTQRWKRLHGVLEKKNFQIGLRSIMSRRLFFGVLRNI